VLTEPGQPVLRLVSTDNLDRQNTKYAVLTHCWGGVEIHSKTTLANVDGYFISIDIETLPKTFREAIQIARALQLRYLWIDSLCIIQQCAPDWEIESAKMAAIFRNATLTISASTAENSTQGCGINTLLPPSKQFTLPYRAALGQRQPYFSISRTNRNPLKIQKGAWWEERPFSEFPIHSRAWIFQEKVLSRRILHATHGFFIYQCATHMDYEDGLRYGDANKLVSHVPGHVLRPAATHNRAYDGDRYLWWSWMHDFTQRQLTKPEDNYAALAGVTALYREMTRDEPVLAMWKSDLVIHLAWEVWEPDRGKVRLAAYPGWERRPSWTWMSYPHGTVHPNIHDVDFEDIDRAVTPRRLTSTRCYKAEVVGLDIQWTGRPLVTPPSNAMVKLRGLKHRLSTRDHKGNGRFDLDPGIAGAGDDHTYDVFALYANKNEPSLNNQPWRLHTAYLALEAVDRENNVYRRIGRFLLYDPIGPGKVAEDHLFGTYEEVILV
jgi:hypothetical protein